MSFYENLLVEIFHRILLPLKERFSFHLSPWFKNDLGCSEKVLWLMLAEIHDNRKHRILIPL